MIKKKKNLKINNSKSKKPLNHGILCYAEFVTSKPLCNALDSSGLGDIQTPIALKNS